MANTAPIVKKTVIGIEAPKKAAIPPVNRQARDAEVRVATNFSPLVDFSI